jgi:hypothetical protein
MKDAIASPAERASSAVRPRRVAVVPAYNEEATVAQVL